MASRKTQVLCARGWQHLSDRNRVWVMGLRDRRGSFLRALRKNGWVALVGLPNSPNATMRVLRVDGSWSFHDRAIATVGGRGASIHCLGRDRYPTA